MRGSKNEESRQWTGGSRPNRPVLRYFFDFVRLDTDEDFPGLTLATVAAALLVDLPDFAVPPPRWALRWSAG